MSKRKKISIPIEDQNRPAETAESAAEAAAEDAVDMAGAEPDLAGAQQELNETVEHLKRLQAEFDNYRKRTDRERQETGAWAQSILVQDLLPVLDDLDRAVAAGDDDSVAQGFTMVADKLRGALEAAGLERIPAVGEDFDPNLHEALLTEAVEADRAGQVLEELVPGYRFKGRVIRPSRVKVGMDS